MTDLPPWDIAHVVDTQVGTANYLQPALFLPPAEDREYRDNRSLWQAVLTERLRCNVTLKLGGFWLFEWFPRSPGLFHTTQGTFSREYALRTAQRVKVPRISGGQQRQDILAFAPREKASMLQGGIGCVRLRPKMTEYGSTWFLSASATLIAHEGFPVALPEHHYDRIIDHITSAGAVSCDLTGRLRFLPEPLVKLFNDYREVPYLYLLVDEIRPLHSAGQDSTKRPLVSVAVSFESEFEGHRGVYASYDTFDASNRNSLADTVTWLEDIYVQDTYKGRVITDFDEHRSHFSDAMFSLDKVTSNTVVRRDVTSLIESLKLHGADVNGFFDGLARANQLSIQVIQQNVTGNNNIVSGRDITTKPSAW
jgi:hypothetical protein